MSSPTYDEVLKLAREYEAWEATQDFYLVPGCGMVAVPKDADPVAFLKEHLGIDAKIAPFPNP